MLVLILGVCMEYPKFSLTMSVYKNDKPEYFVSAMKSILSQTVVPDEIVLTVDGPITDKLNEKITEYMKNENIKVIRSEHNQGLGLAHALGVNHCTHEWIAIMDSDDICAKNRFELQLKYVIEHPEVDLLGGQIEEFIDYRENIVGKRAVPLDNKSIYKYFRLRQPINHMTFFFKKNSVLRVGNYEHWFLDEDYFLIAKMVKAKMVFANLPETLCYVRVSNEMYARRGGYKYFLSEKKLQDWLLKNKLIPVPIYLFNVITRFIVQVIISNKIRSKLFQIFFRKKSQ